LAHTGGTDSNKLHVARQQVDYLKFPLSGRKERSAGVGKSSIVKFRDTIGRPLCLA